MTNKTVTVLYSDSNVLSTPTFGYVTWDTAKESGQLSWLRPWRRIRRWWREAQPNHSLRSQWPEESTAWSLSSFMRIWYQHMYTYMYIYNYIVWIYIYIRISSMYYTSTIYIDIICILSILRISQGRCYRCFITEQGQHQNILSEHCMSHLHHLLSRYDMVSVRLLHVWHWMWAMNSVEHKDLGEPGCW